MRSQLCKCNTYSDSVLDHLGSDELAARTSSIYHDLVNLQRAVDATTTKHEPKKDNSSKVEYVPIEVLNCRGEGVVRLELDSPRGVQVLRDVHVAARLGIGWSLDVASFGCALDTESG